MYLSGADAARRQGVMRQRPLLASLTLRSPAAARDQRGAREAGEHGGGRQGMR